MSKTPKIKPTPEMLKYRKELAQQQVENNNTQQDYNLKASTKRQVVQRRINKLKKDRDLAVEAAIGYGLAIKSLEESLREQDEELQQLQEEIDSKRPPYLNTFGLFKAKFGYDEHEVEWGEDV